ncbi:class I adenylate-forming enzyme family protein [Aquisediminimonas sediminicola]|uniref:class I adenylate-forming enzyme family protein n=1 Tax=Alteraquisediminimonas sediminicola TaxID=2676787 RepID=UPI001C8DD38A|nr:AMP-binding protein [Aquisediminimonas sediminicola]
MYVSGSLTVPTLLDQKAGLHPEKPCVIFEDANGGELSLSYAELADRVSRLADALGVAGVRLGDNVALMMGNCVEFLIAWIAINRAGAVMVSVNVFYSADELRYLLNHSESVAFISEPRFVSLFEEVSADCPSVKIRLIGRNAEPVSGFHSMADFIAFGSVDQPAVPVSAEAISQIVYTSGTTSRPKGVLISHQSSIIQGVSISQTLGMRNDDRTCVVLPLFHVNGQYVGVLSTLAVGGTVVLLESYSATRFWQQVRRHQCTLISIVPMQLRTMLAQPVDPGDADHHVRVAFYALQTTDEEWDAFEARFGVRLVEGYGLSETLGICTCNPLMLGGLKRHSIGLPVLGREIRVLDEDGREQVPGQAGRIMVRGEPLFSGYFRNPAATAEALRDGWLDTGDNGCFDADGYLHFLDRTKDIIKRAGENIAASEVERVLNEHPMVAESAVIAVPDPLRDEAVKAFVVPVDGTSLDEAALHDWCARHLSKFKVPSFYEFVPSLPKTSIGKIQKYILKQGGSHVS